MSIVAGAEGLFNTNADASGLISEQTVLSAALCTVRGMDAIPDLLSMIGCIPPKKALYPCHICLAQQSSAMSSQVQGAAGTLGASALKACCNILVAGTRSWLHRHQNQALFLGGLSYSALAGN